MERRLIRPGAAPSAPWHDHDALDDYGQSAEPDWRDTDWLRELNKIEIDGIPFNYVDIGSGDCEPVVLVHGLGGQWQNWLENIPRLAERRRVVAMDLPGFGLTPEPDDDEKITITRYGRWVNELADRLELGKVDLVGNSMGGYIAAEVAIQFPERVSQLVLVSAAGISSAETIQTPILTFGRIAAAVAANSVTRYRRLAARPVSRHLSLALVARHPRLLKPDLAYEGFFKGGGKPGFGEGLRASLNYDFRDRLPDVKVPTLIVWGERDSIIPTRDADEFERLIEDSRKVVMKDTGHVPMAERPQAFNDVLVDFLDEEGRAEDREAVDGESQAA